MDKVKIQESIDILIRQLNVLGGEKEIAEEYVKELMNQHRTLQQNFWRNIKNVAEIYSKTELYDARNEASIEFTKEISKIEGYLPFV